MFDFRAFSILLNKGTTIFQFFNKYNGLANELLNPQILYFRPIKLVVCYCLFLTNYTNSVLWNNIAQSRSNLLVTITVLLDVFGDRHRFHSIWNTQKVLITLSTPRHLRSTNLNPFFSLMTKQMGREEWLKVWISQHMSKYLHT